MIKGVIMNRISINYLIALFIMIFGMSAMHAVSADPDRRDQRFWGEWKTEKGKHPNISIVLKKGNQIVIINNKKINFKYEYISRLSRYRFFAFQNVVDIGPNGGESYIDIGLVLGKLNSRKVLSGFYSELDHDSNDNIIKNKISPVVLYKQKK